MGVLRPAREDELRWIWPAVRAARLFESARELEAHWRGGPWRVQVSDRREAVLLQRWRQHLDVLAVRGLWCTERRLPVIIPALAGVARLHGFRRLLSPLVPEDSADAYRACGMHEVESILALRLERPGHADDVPAPPGVTLRLGTVDDALEVVDLDHRAFDEFWRYDHDTIERYASTERLALAQTAESVIGYTLCAVSGAEGTLGRLAVHPDWQGRGVGTTLLQDALHYLGRRGARAVTLSTQVDNAKSRRLYASAGFRELAGRLLFLMCEDLPGSEEGAS